MSGVLGDLEGRELLLEDVGVDESSLVAQVLGALAEMLVEDRLGVVFEDVAVFLPDAVPEPTKYRCGEYLGLPQCK